MKWIKQNDEVFYPTQDKLLSIGDDDIKYLQQMSERNSRRRARFCTHQSINDEVHEMIIFHGKGAYVRPHKHLLKTESFHLVKGRADVLVFNEDGDLKQVLNLGEYNSGNLFYYKVPDSCYHMQIFKDDTVFHEVTKGPFQEKDTVCASWAPDEDQKLLVEQYIKELNEKVIIMNNEK